MQNKMLYYAKLYIDLGFSPIPIRPDGKAPAVSFKNLESITYEHANKWWGNHPDWQIALQTIDFLVIDVDVNHGETGINGFDVINEYKKQKWWNDDTLIATTPNGGKHYYYLKQPNTEYKQSLGRVDSNHPGVDVKANINNYVLCYPSSNKHGQYKWDNMQDYYDFKRDNDGYKIIKGYIRINNKYIKDKHYDKPDIGHRVGYLVKSLPTIPKELMTALNMENKNKYFKHKKTNMQYNKITKNVAIFDSVNSTHIASIFYWLANGYGDTKQSHYEQVAFVFYRLLNIGVDMESAWTLIEKNNLLLSNDEQFNLYKDILNDKMDYVSLKSVIYTYDDLPCEQYNGQKVVDILTIMANGLGNEGSRNDLLYSMSRRMKSWGIANDIIMDLMTFANINTQNPLSDDEAYATILSAINRN